MRRILSLLSAAALLMVPASASALGLKTNFTETITGPIKLEIVLSEDLAHRANNLPKNLSDRTSGSRRTGSFASNGHYGDESLTYLIHDLNKELTDDFAKRDIVLSNTATIVLKVTLEKVKPNRPTRNQRRRDSNLSRKSYSIGGADISVDVISSSGSHIGSAKFDYYGSFGERPIFILDTWLDTERAFEMFSRSLSKKLVKAGASATS